MFVHPCIGLFAGRTGQPPEAVEVLISPRHSVRRAVRVEHRRVELAPRWQGARGEVGEPRRVPIRGRTLELEAQFARPLCRRSRDRMLAQQVGQI